MKILSIDTSSKICSIALLEDDRLIEEISENNGYTHSETLMPLIDKLLSKQNLTLKNIDLIICDKGPGSFTGIRIGVATAKGFSDSLNISSIGISSLEALAYNVKNTGLICSLIDAKNQNTYWSLFENNDDNYTLKEQFSIDNINNILENLPSKYSNITFVGDGSLMYKNLIQEKMPESKFCENNELSAYNLALAGFKHFQNNKIDELLPLYLRKSQAERLLENKNIS